MSGQALRNPKASETTKFSRKYAKHSGCKKAFKQIKANHITDCATEFK